VFRIDALWEIARVEELLEAKDACAARRGVANVLLGMVDIRGDIWPES